MTLYSPVRQEQLISIQISDESDDSARSDGIEGSDLMVDFQSETEFQTEINRRKEQNNTKFKNKWNEILTKYLQIDDDKESDEINLLTGEVITDNGHLRMLETAPQGKGIRSPFSHNIWSTEFDWENDAKNEKLKVWRMKKKKKELRERLKEQNLFHRGSNTHSSEAKRPGEADSILLLTPSPTKKAKLSPVKQGQFGIRSSPPRAQIGEYDLKHGGHKHHEDNMFDFRSLHMSLDGGESESRSPEGLDLGGISETSQTSDIYSGEDIDEYQGKETEVESDGVYDGSSDSSFDDEYLILSSPKASPKSRSIYQCHFEDCFYCTGNKYMYKSHLVKEHSSELKLIGYPVSQNNETHPSNITEDNIDLLMKDFPLVHEVPHLPLTSTGEPIICGKLLANGRKCKKWFLTKHEREEHFAKYPLRCSSKRQVLLCPMLGCGFMTDEGYLSWRNHFIDTKHFLHPRYSSPIKNRVNASPTDISRDRSDSIPSDISDDIPTIRKLLQGSESEFPVSTDHDGYESIDELFSN